MLMPVEQGAPQCFLPLVSHTEVDHELRQVTTHAVSPSDSTLRRWLRAALATRRIRTTHPRDRTRPPSCPKPDALASASPRQLGI